MAIYYLDLENGNDANNGTSFALRKKTFSSITSVVSSSGGDTVRVMGCGAPKLVGNATWNQNSKTVTLASAVTQLITNCESAWTASANVTCTTNTGRKSGSVSADISIAAAFTTGKVAYFATGTLNLSAYQQVTFWINKYSGTLPAANQLSIRLCTDTTGDVSVHTCSIPALVNGWNAITVDLATNLNSAIQSIALYQDVDIAAVGLLIDNINAAKASSSADALTLSSMIGKVHNTNWAASTAYSLNDVRRPSIGNRNGFQYKVTTAGTSGSSEPTWPTEPGLTVTDGSVVWTCSEVEDTWYNIQSINGTTVLIDNGSDTNANQGLGYAGATETVATYRITPIVINSGSFITFAGNSATNQTFYIGGWDRTNMSTQDGETWYRSNNSQNGPIATVSGINGIVFQNFGFSQYNYGGNSCFDQKINCEFRNVSFVGLQNFGVVMQTFADVNGLKFTGFALCNCDTNRPMMQWSNCWGEMKRVRFENNLSGSLSRPSILELQYGAPSLGLRIIDGYFRNNGTQNCIAAGGNALDVIRVTFSSNAFYEDTNNIGPQTFHRAKDCVFNSSVVATGGTLNARGGVWSQNHNGTAGSHQFTQSDSSTIVSDTSVRNTASGISWKFSVKNTGVTSAYPMVLSVAKILLLANTTKTVTIAHRRDSTNIQGQLLVRGSQVRGIPNDVTVSLAPTINTWTTSSPMTLTATEDGVVELLCLVWDGVGTTNNFWIDDLSVT